MEKFENFGNEYVKKYITSVEETRNGKIGEQYINDTCLSMVVEKVSLENDLIFAIGAIRKYNGSQSEEINTEFIDEALETLIQNADGNSETIKSVLEAMNCSVVEKYRVYSSLVNAYKRVIDKEYPSYANKLEQNIWTCEFETREKIRAKAKIK